MLAVSAKPYSGKPHSAKPYSVCHLSDDVLRKEAADFALGERSNFVQLLVRIAEIDVRRLYLRAGYPCISSYCMEEFRLTEDEALKRVHAARTAHHYPMLFEAMDDGRLSMTAVSMLAPHLTPGNVDELAASAAACPRLHALRTFLQRFAEPDLLRPAPVEVVNSPAPERVSVAAGPGPVERGPSVEATTELPPAGPPMVNSLAPERPSAPVEDLEWVEVRVKVRRSKLQRARDLLSHAVPSGNAIQVFDRALDALIEKAERKKFATGSKPRAPRPRSAGARLIPTHVRRAVWERDGAQCTFVSESGRRCSSRRRIEYDHIRPVARGGEASIENLRLRCSGHNQYEAEQAFGTEFMKKKRERARPAGDGVEAVATKVAEAPSPSSLPPGAGKGVRSG